MASVAAYVALAEAIRPDLQAHVALAQSLPKHGKELNHAIKEYLDDEKRMLEKAIGLEFDRNEERHSIAKFLRFARSLFFIQKRK